jgi:hypothetical protein
MEDIPTPRDILSIMSEHVNVPYVQRDSGEWEPDMKTYIPQSHSGYIDNVTNIKMVRRR